ncbi:MAG: OmpA family protein [Rhodospirillaceae bacterium]|nr:OmpA family protein [Rhodospirillaceae bacterium]
MTAAAEHGGKEESDVISTAVRWVVPFALCMMLSACSTVTDVWDGTTDAVGSFFSSDEDEIAEETEGGYPDLANVAADASQLGSAVERGAATEGLIADRNQAQYTEQVRRRDPVAVRPLKNGPEQPVAQASNEPPPPVAAPIGQVTQVDPAARIRPSLAERLGAAPPPPPPASAANAPPPPTVPSVPAAISAAQVQSPSTSSTVVIGGSDPVSSVQTASVPNALSSYDASAYRVSTHLTTITFPTGSSRLTSSDRSALDDVIKLRSEYNGAIRVIGHASSRTQNLDPLRHKLANFRVSLNRANAVAAALMSKGLPADRLFVGAVSDNEPLYYEVMPAGESGNQRAEIYLDY